MSERRNLRLRWLERHFGIPLVARLAARRLVRRLRPAAPPRVGVLESSGIGDTVLLSDVAQNLARLGSEVVLFRVSEKAGAGRLATG